MKKINLMVLAMFILSLFPMKADEGMWLLPLLEKMNGKKMAEMGFTLTPEDIYSLNHSSLKDAIVQFGGGCTGEIVSKNGLLFTNHHCGYGSIQKLSSVEHNYLKDGFWAMSLEEELPAEGLTVKFLESFTDVTKQIEKALKGAATPEERDAKFAEAAKAIKEKAVKGNEFLTADVKSFYGGNTYYLIVYKIYKDVRFVGAPPSSIGKFGADTDNWMWPRHTGDFSVFRVYADKNNNPADYSPDNVPYTPKNFLKISLKGIQEGDPTIIMGYPGRTNRFMTRSELVEQRDLSNAIAIKLRGIRQEVLMADMEADPKIMIQYASKYSGSSNGWKKWIGMNETFAKLNVEERRAQEEAKFTEWVNQSSKRVEKYGKALEKINTAVAGRAESYALLLKTSESVGRIELTSIISRVLRNIDNQERLNATLESFYKDYSASTDRKVAKAMIKAYLEEVCADNRADFVKVIESDFGGDVDAYVDNMFDNSAFVSKEKFNEAIAADVDLNEDPAVKLFSSISDVQPNLIQAYTKDAEMFAQGKKEYIAGTLEMRKGEAIYPDANSTMRLTYGQVLPYSPRDAVEYLYYTTLDGVMEKEDPSNWEFEVPARLKELWKNKDFGQYGLPNGKMPVCFLSNNDITGGNSGSPILNGNGELIGLAFDGNWESMSSDIIFEPELQRCINVDARYVLFIIDKFGGAGYLLDEMEIVK
jgi:hypothetical protein